MSRRVPPRGLCRIVVAFLAVSLGATGAPAEPPPRPLADHVVLVSIDGLRPEFYRDPAWPTPVLQQMAAEGAHAEMVRSVFPSVTYPAHTTMITGALPVRHGIVYNEPFEAGGQTGRWYWEAASIRRPTLWDAARTAGLSVASLGWPVSVGAQVDWNLPEIWPLDPGVDPLGPFRDAVRPRGLLAELEREATGRLTAANFTIDHVTRDDRMGAIAAYLLERYRPALLTVHLIEADHFQHEEGREGRMVRRALAAADRAIGQMVEAAERAGIRSRTAFLVTGDHGFIDLHTALAPNVWLVEAGLRSAAGDRGHWRATFHTAAAAAFLHLEDPEDAQAADAVWRLLESLPPGLRRLFTIVVRSELDELGAAPDAVFALAPVPGVRFVADAEGSPVRPAMGATHGYLPGLPAMATGFVGWGAGFRAGAVAPELHLADLAALTAYLLNLPLETPDGVVPLGLLEGTAPVP